MLFEVERLLRVATGNGTLPKYLLLENVKNLVSKKFRADFDSWLLFLSGLGYTNYWKVLNAKDYGIPQNRERVFCVSIRGEHQPYTFPKAQELKLRLRDLIDKEVDARYYLKESTIKSLLRHILTAVGTVFVCLTDLQTLSVQEIGVARNAFKWVKLSAVSGTRCTMPFCVW